MLTGVAPAGNRILIVGDVSSTVRPEGGTAFGGYAYELSMDLKSVGQSPLPACRVGKDPSGQGIIRKFQGRGIPTHLLELDNSRATSRTISFADSPPKIEHGASDFLSHFDTIIEGSHKADLFSFNSVLFRTPGSGGTIFRILEEATVPCRHFEIDLSRVGTKLDPKDVEVTIQLSEVVTFRDVDVPLICEALGLPELNGSHLVQVLQERFLKTWVLCQTQNGRVIVASAEGWAETAADSSIVTGHSMVLARFLSSLGPQLSPEEMGSICLGNIEVG